MTGPQEIPVPSGTDVGHDFQLVNQVLLDRTLRFLREKARQNHGLHASWNEGANGDFATCTRADCTEAREYLTAWGWDL
jgi:hypothetical protein